MIARNLTRRGVIGAAGIVALTSCAGGNIGGKDSAPKQQKGVSTAVPRAEVALKLSFVDDPPTASLLEGFKKKFANVTVDAKQTSFSDYVKTIKLAMASDNPPDLAEYNAGAMRSLVPANKILNLDPYAEAYGWDKTFPASSLEILKADASAKVYGTGSLYAVPGALSVVGVFYHKKIVESAGADPAPKDFASFERSLQMIKGTKTTPLSVGALEANGLHLWCSLVNSLGDLDAYRAWAYGKKGASIEGGGFERATAKMADWMTKDYIADGANATSSADALANFVKGKTAFHITGNWAAAAVEKELGDDAGFFLLPQASAGTEPAASGASVAYSISAATKDADVAAAFLNYLCSADAAQRQYDSGFMPVNTQTEIKNSDQGLKSQIADDFKRVVDGAGIVPFPDVASPGMLDKLISGVQGVLSGRTSSKAFLSSLQGEWSQYHD